MSINILLTNNFNPDLPELVNYTFVDITTNRWGDFDNGEIENLYSYHTLDSLNEEQSLNHLNNMLSKVAIGGTLTLVDYEFELLISNVLNRSMQIEDFNKVLEYIKSIRSSKDLLSKIPSNFRLVVRKIENNRYYLSFVREN